MANVHADVRKIASDYVLRQVKNFDVRVPKREISKAVTKVSEAIAELRSAYSAQRTGK